ncbi:MAG TPA: chloride channel protein [Candidatus Acidoferrales bacterium]|nr:chloride channel protein [Candidatus Acidoferrales bacterium]HTS66376.1 chloride channel protein [Candidatus Acidoferrales bacterium]
MASMEAGHRHEEKVLLVLTLIIGAVVGLVVVAFILLTENLGARLYPPGSAAWRRVLVPIAGALSTGFLLSKYFPYARGSGIPQTKVALFLRDGYISMRTVLGKFGLCSVSLATGIALGREGPSVQVGAGIASVLGRRLGLSTKSVRALVPVGASAALAAAFNTPIAAVLFSLEEVMGNLHAPVLGSIVLSSATSWIVLHLVLGDEPLFHVPAYQLVHPIEFLFYGALGVIGGFVSVGFVRLLLWQRKYFLAMPQSIQWLLPTVGGAAVGLMGWFVPQVLGVGYGFVSQALNGQILIGTMVLLVILKIIATATCYASGNAGGIFGPSLFIGAMMGGAVGGGAHMLLPDYTGSVGAYALVGMGAAFAGIVRVPLTSVIMIFEVTRDYSIIVPLMIANLMSYFISSRLQEEPIYEALQHQDGVHLPAGTREPVETPLLVGSVYRAGAGELPIPAESLTQESYPHVHPDHTVEDALKRIASSGMNALPVISRSNVREVLGTISVEDILAAYRRGDVAGTPQAAGGAAIPIRMIMRALVAVIAVALVGGFLNYAYRGERASRAQKSFAAGNQLAAQGHTEEAIEQYRNALSISHSAEQRLALGMALLKAGRLNEAELYLREVARERPENAAVHAALGEAEFGLGKYAQARESFLRAVKINPSDSGSAARAALCDQKLGKR